MRILIADDHRLFIEGTSAILQSLLDDAVIDCVFDGPGVLTQITREPYDIALLDLRLPGINGFDLLKELKHRMSLVPILVLTASDDPLDAKHARQLGARGFLSKKMSGKNIAVAVKRVVQGELVFENTIAGIGRSQRYNDEWGQLHNITPRQLEVLRLIKQGLSNQAIADKLAISRATAKTHVAAILTTLDAKSRTEAVDAAQLLGLD